MLACFFSVLIIGSNSDSYLLLISKSAGSSPQVFLTERKSPGASSAA
jgi:hypothetical protein